MLTGALTEACLYVADADDTEAAKNEVGALIVRLLSALRVSVPNEDEPQPPRPPPGKRTKC